MTSPRDIKARLIAIAEPVCAANGYQLVDLDYESGNAGWVVRFYIDHAPGHVSGLSGGISFADCEALSRELGAVLDVEDPVPHAYQLEVSSPGLDRPLRLAEHFREQIGQTVKIELAAGIDGRRNFKGVLQAVDAAGDRVVVAVDGQAFELPIADIARARVVPDWDALLKRDVAKERATRRLAERQTKQSTPANRDKKPKAPRV